MKLFKTFLIIIVATTIVFGQFEYEEELFVPWGKNNENVKYRVAPGGQYGPTSFNIVDENIIILDAQNQKVKLFNNKTFEKAVDIPFYNADDILWQNENDYYILSKNTVHKMNKSSVINHYSTTSPKILISDMRKNEIGQISLSTNKLTTLKINTLQKGNSLQEVDGIPDGQNGQIKTIRKNSQIAEVQLADKSSYQISVNNLGMIQYIGATPEGFKYFLIEQITQQVPLKVARYIYLMNDNGELKAKFNLPNIAFTHIFKEFEVDKNGNLFQMISAKEGIHIIKWKYKNKFSDTAPTIEYPENLKQSYHFNEFEYPFDISLPNLKKKSKITGSVTPAEALATADSYIVCQWTGSSTNRTNGVETINSAYVKTPSSNNGEWWIIGSNTSVPYKWGGNTPLNTFESAIVSGAKAGDMETSRTKDGYICWGNTYDVGVDCSGYVSNIWTCDRKSTSTMHEVSFELGSWDNMAPADAANKAGSHIRLNVERNANGSFLMAEATGSGWACRYYSFSTSALSSYVPIRYDEITGSDFIATPELNTVKLFGTNSQQTVWSSSDTTSTGGHNIYRFVEGGAWEKIETVNSSTLTLNSAIGDGVASFYKVKSKSKSDSDESLQTDSYGVQYDSNNSEKFLIVDGFDRINDYAFSYHEFAMDFGMALRKYKYSFETCSNDAVIAGDVNLNDYDAVFWNLGDESTADETFNSTEQTKVTNYLKQGGNLFVSGSEVGWDLDYKGGTSDKNFYNNFLKANYSADDSEDYSVYGETGTVFSGLSFGYDDGTHGIWNVNYPDVITTNGGSEVALRYDASKVAGIQYSGTVSGGTSVCKVVYIGFPFETIYDEAKREEFAGKILKYFGYDDTKSSIENVTPNKFKLIGNYPNPFNNSTVIKFNLPNSGNVEITVYNINGQKVATAFNGNLNTGINNISFTSDNLSSGIYIYRVKTNSNISQGKMMLIK